MTATATTERQVYKPKEPTLLSKIFDRWILKLAILIIVIVWIIPTLGVLISSLAGDNDSKGDFPAIGYEYFSEHSEMARSQPEWPALSPNDTLSARTAS
jgi:hypothetical protein